MHSWGRERLVTAPSLYKYLLPCSAHLVKMVNCTDIFAVLAGTYSLVNTTRYVSHRGGSRLRSGLLT